MLRLPEPDRTELPRSPLDLVVCQVRFERTVAVSDAAKGLAFHEALGGREGPYPKLEQRQAQALNVTFVPGSPAQFSQPQPLSGWHLEAADENWNVQLMPEHLGLETRAYSTWEEFRGRFSAALKALVDVVAPVLESRIGLRYVDRIQEPRVTSPEGWAPYIAQGLLGLACHPVLGSAIVAQQHQVVIDLGDGAACRFAHGLLRADDERLHYILDYDLHREGSRSFDTEEIMSKLDEFNTDALKLFHSSTTPELLDALRVEG